jgi:uncharacterized cupredoxin-like copper-binding protein
MSTGPRRSLFGAAALVPFGLSSPARADLSVPVVKVFLWDMGASSMDSLEKVKGMGMAMSGKPDRVHATMGVTTDLPSIKAGDVMFEVTNTSRDMIHEMIVMPMAAGEKEVPYKADEARIDEDAAGAIGEVSELDPGATGKVTLRLKPGTYMLVCNLPGHYVLGMWTHFEVTA